MKIGGLVLCFAGMALLCAMDAVAKALGPHFNAFQIGLIRYGGAALWLVLYLTLSRGMWPSRANWRQHLARAALMVVTACLFFYAVTHLPLAMMTALAMTAPVYVSLIGIVFLKERPTRSLFVAIALGIAGSLVIVLGGPLTATGGDMSGWIAGLLAPISYAAAIVLLKHHSNSEGAEAVTLSTAALAALILLPAALPGLTLPPATIWPLLPLIGFLGAGGFVLLTLGLRTTPASTFAVVDYASLLWAALFGYVFFSETPEVRFWIGGVLIVCACVVVMRSTRKITTGG